MATNIDATDDSTDTASDLPRPGDDGFEEQHLYQMLYDDASDHPNNIVENYDDEQYDEPYRDPDVLQRLYWDHDMSMIDIADLCGCGEGTVYRWMERNDIPRRTPTYEKCGSLMMNQGYEGFQVDVNGKKKKVSIHRLAAIAWFGYDEVVDNDVHHSEYEIKWLNTEWNLDLMKRAEHRRAHRSKSEKYPLTGNEDEIQRLLQLGYSSQEIADEFECTPSAVRSHTSRHDLDSTDATGQTDLETFTGGVN